MPYLRIRKADKQRGCRIRFVKFFTLFRVVHAHAKAVVQSWADGEWFKNRPTLADKISLRVFKVTGETNTDDLSPAPVPPTSTRKSPVL